ncbi:MAG: TylF/MycF/NovP-related O-methyltransferase [Chloroherpetonaceae bacterium]
MFEQPEINQQANVAIENYTASSEKTIDNHKIGLKFKYWLLSVRLKFIKLVKDILNFLPGRKHFFYKYSFLFEPPQLAYLGNCICETKDIDGSIIEIGCAEGMTTIFLKKYMNFYDIHKEYVCIDTFAGFTKADINFESQKRQKSQEVLKIMFSINRKSWVDRTLKMNGITDVQTYVGDINLLDLKDVGVKKISFALVDLDLYLPVLSALEKFYPLLQEGGIIVVDDCTDHEYFDGAYQAYKEFCSKYCLEENITLERLGIIRK